MTFEEKVNEMKFEIKILEKERSESQARVEKQMAEIDRLLGVKRELKKEEAQASSFYLLY